MSRDIAEEDDRSASEEGDDRDDENIYLEDDSDMREVIASDRDDLEDAFGDQSDVDDSRQHIPEVPDSEPHISLTPTQAATQASQADSTASSSFPAQDLPIPEIAASFTVLASLTTTMDLPNDQPFTLDGPATRIGRKRKARDLQAILEVCICGQAVTDNEISSGENVIKCKSIGCETGWVSQKILQKNSLITEMVSSTIDNV